MPTKTKPPPPPPHPRPSLPGSKTGALAALLALAAGGALLELLAGLFLGAFPLTGRAEAFVFLLARPWVALLVSAAALWMGWPLRRRVTAYGAFLLLAGVSESHLMLRLGNPSPWAEMLRGSAAGAALALAAEALLSLPRRFLAWRWLIGAAAALALLLALPPVRQAWEQAVAVPPPPAPAGPKPQVLLMTALPLVWGEGGAFDPSSRPAAIYTALQREFALRPIDAPDPPSLAGAPLLLLIQPRWLAPEELVTLDSWVRRGGRVLILTDPRLNWHSELPLGDIRRPPATGLLKPLLDHWGLAMKAGPRWSDTVHGSRRLVTEHPGRLTARGSACRAARAELAECRLGEGRAIVLADADLTRDELWVGEGAQGATRHRRLSDNPLVIADLLDRLAGVERPRALGDARWHRADASLPNALLWTGLPLLALMLAGLAALLLHRSGAR